MTKLALSLLALFGFTLSHAQTSAALTYEVVPTASEARYRVREQLANVSLPTTLNSRNRSCFRC